MNTSMSLQQLFSFTIYGDSEKHFRIRWLTRYARYEFQTIIFIENQNHNGHMFLVYYTIDHHIYNYV